MNKKEENGCSLKVWLSEHNVNKGKDIGSFKKLFYNLDFEMKSLHRMGEYVYSFNIDDILVYDDSVKYKKTSRLYSDDRQYIINKNIFYLSCLAIGIYNDCLDFINPENLIGVRELFSSFVDFIPEDVLPYYKGIIERESSVYLCDYVRAKVDREIEANKNLLESDSSPLINGSSKNVQNYTKSTLAGRIFADDNTSAFIKLILFPVIIFLLAILIPIMAILKIKG